MMRKERGDIDMFKDIKAIYLEGVALILLKQIPREGNDPFFMRKDIVSFVPYYQGPAHDEL